LLLILDVKQEDRKASSEKSLEQQGRSQVQTGRKRAPEKQLQWPTGRSKGVDDREH